MRNFFVSEKKWILFIFKRNDRPYINSDKFYQKFADNSIINEQEYFSDWNLGS